MIDTAQSPQCFNTYLSWSDLQTRHLDYKNFIRLSNFNTYQLPPNAGADPGGGLWGLKTPPPQHIREAKGMNDVLS